MKSIKISYHLTYLAASKYQGTSSKFQSQSVRHAQLGRFYLMQDKNDESLEQYKKTLLGNIKEEQLKEDEPAEVEIVKIELVCQGRPKGNITLPFRNHDPKEIRKFKIKESSIYCMRIHFVVRNDIVFGLKFVNNVYKLLAKGLT